MPIENYIIYLLCHFGITAIALYLAVSQYYYAKRYDENNNIKQDIFN